MYMGMSPFDAPGTYSLLQYTELAEGIWYPRGGFHKIVEGLINIGQRLGVEYRLSTPVARVALSAGGRKATGVELIDGTTLHADLVICNADLIYAYNNLLPQTTYAKSLSTRKTSCSSISFYWAMSQTVPELKAHNIFLADEYKDSFDAIFQDHVIPTEPSFYVNVPSRVDPTAAPEGCDSIVVLVPVGHLLSDDSSMHKGTSSDAYSTQDWPKLISIARQKILSTIKTRTGVDIAPLILHEHVNDPLTWKENFNLDRGGILGLSHSFFNVLSFRPKTKHANIGGLYFVGASTHPGTGVPICLAGGKIVASQILNDLDVEIPWSDGGMLPMSTRKEVSELDEEHPPFATLRLIRALLVLVVFVMAAYLFWSDIMSLGPPQYGTYTSRNKFLGMSAGRHEL
jgi:phytoene desaturase (3,4-didehydrolycopene-forming)